MKAIAPYLKYLNYLVWLGPMLILAGITAGIVAGVWSPIPMGMIFLGILVIGVWLVALSLTGVEISQPGFWKRRSTEASTNALIATVSVLVILGLLNFLAVRYGGRIDLTDSHVFTLAPETQQLVRTLKQPVKVVVFSSQQNPQDRELLESYRRQGQQFSFEFINPIAQPTIAQSFDMKSVGDVYIESGKRRQFVQTVEVPQANRVMDRLSEVKLTNAIERMANEQPIQVYFLQGHGERPIAAGRGAMLEAMQSLADKNYTVKPLNLGETPEFPQDADVIVVAGPQKPLLDPEVKALQDYLDRGGNLLLMLDPKTDPNLDTLLKPWGVSLDQRVVLDVSGRGRLINLGPAEPLVTHYGDHPITRDFGSTNGSYYPFARPIVTTAVDGVTSTPLLYTNENSWAESDLKTNPPTYDPATDRPGSIVLGVALSRPITATQAAQPKADSDSTDSQPTPTPSSPSPAPSPTSSLAPQATPAKSPEKQSRLVVIGNSTFATDGPFEQFVNGDVFLNSVRWLSQQDQVAMSIRPKEAKNRRLLITKEQEGLAKWTAIGILPLLAFGTALFVWWRRR
ncbi:MAG TPA: Gldg family protein [Microcoleaceae cyanobacterium]|jgi:ABC-type uncharacterized transport system involved in gliding motility auxiliary subunit